MDKKQITKLITFFFASTVLFLILGSSIYSMIPLPVRLIAMPFFFMIGPALTGLYAVYLMRKNSKADND